MKDKIIVKVGVIINGSLQSERVLELTWPNNETAELGKLVNDMIGFFESDPICKVEKLK